MKQPLIAFRDSNAPSNGQQSSTLATMQNRRPPASRATRPALILALLLLLVATASVLLVSSGAIPHILYKGSSVSLNELNEIRARGEATICVQQVSALSHFIGMSFDYQCFDSEAEADANVHEVEAHLQAP